MDQGTTNTRDDEYPNSHPEVDAEVDESAATTEHLRRLWLADARDITVTYDADVVRHRTYLSHPRTET